MLKKAIGKLSIFKNLEQNLLLLFITGVIAVIALQLIQPFFPLFLQSLNASEMEISLVISISSIIGTLVTLPAGYLIDRVGEKKMLLLGIIFWASSTLLIAFTNNWGLVAVLYSFHSIGTALVGPARMTMISASSQKETEATIFALMSLDWFIGGTIAPPVTGYLAETSGWQLPLLIASTLFFISIVPALKLDTRSIVKKEKKETPKKQEQVVHYSVFMYFMFSFLSNSALAVISTILPLFLKNQLSLSTSIIGLFFTSANILGIFSEIPGGVIADRYGKKKIMILLMLPLPLIYWVWGVSTGWLAYLVLYVLSQGLVGLMGPATLAIVSEVFPEEHKGSAFGIRMAGIRFGSAVGPLLGGYLYGSMGSMSPFIGAGILFLLSIPFIYLLK